MTDPMLERLNRLRERLGVNEIDALLVSQRENRQYLSGFTGSSGWLLISEEQALIAGDFRYYEQIEQECSHFRLCRVTGRFAETLQEMFKTTGAKRVGFEATTVPVADWQRWQKATGDEVQWVATYELVENLRAQKDNEELELLRKAVHLTDEAMAHGLKTMHPGISEKEVAWNIEVYMRTHGAQGVAFDGIVAGGPHSAMPHARATDTPLVEGQPIVIDIGARVNGYCGDLTRTVCLGEPDDRFDEIYSTVLRAHEAAKAAIRSGVTGKDAHLVAQKIIEEAGYGANFGHGLGHGVGLAIHEKPTASRYSTDTLQIGSVVTVEPGIYIPGWGGIRTEDIVVVREDGVETLTGAPKEPIIPL